MSNQYASKVVLSNGTTVIDLTSDTLTPGSMLEGTTGHDKSGAPIVGTCTYDSDTSSDTAAVSEILVGKTAHARGTQLTGTMRNNGAVTGYISTKNGTYTIPQGFHDGSGTVGIAATEVEKITAGNIKAGITILGTEGEYTGEAITAQSKTVTPSWSAQTVQPDSGYDYLSSVSVASIPITYSDNAAGGQTVTIG